MTNSNSCKGAIVIGGHINGLGIVRSLAALGIDTAVILTKRHDLAHCSRYVKAHESAFDLAEKPGQLLEALDRRSSSWKGWALFPTNDEALAAITLNRQHLESAYRLIAPPEGTVPYFLNKELMLETAEAAGIPVPFCYGTATRDMACRSDIRFPVIIKPVAGYQFYGRFGCKLLPANSSRGLAGQIANVEKSGIPCQVFDLIPGPDHLIYCCCVYIGPDGTPRAKRTVRKLRQSPPFFGVARVAEVSTDNAQLMDATIELLRKIRYRGIAVTEFKLDPRDGTYRFLEVNGRSVIYNTLLRRSGMDFAKLAWADYIEHRNGIVPQCHWPGVWINSHADMLYSILRGRREGMTVKNFLSPYFRLKIDAVWSARDPVPFFKQWSWTIGQGIRKVSAYSEVKDTPFIDDMR